MIIKLDFSAKLKGFLFQLFPSLKWTDLYLNSRFLKKACCHSTDSMQKTCVLKNLPLFQLSNCRHNVICHLVKSDAANPYLIVWALTSDDPLLVDSGNVSLVCRIDQAEMRLDCTLLTWNRRLLRAFSCQDTEGILLPLIGEMAGQKGKS